MTTNATPPKLQFLDSNGALLVGGKLYTYAAGTTTPQVTYTDFGGGTANANPVILDSRGEASVWLGTALYKMALYSATDVLIWTVDNIGGFATLAQLAASGGSSLVGFLQAGTGAVATTVQTKLRESVSVKDFGAVGDGVTDDTAAIQAALTASSNVYFPDGSYLITSQINKTGNNVFVNFANATIVNGGAGYTFFFGVVGDAATYTGLNIIGGYFTQQNPATTSNLNYIRIAGYSRFNVSNCNLKNVSNGGILLSAGCFYGVISNIQINGMSGYSTNRGIWVTGDQCTGFNASLVDTNSLTRNATPLPAASLLNISVQDCQIYGVTFGIYVDNTINASILDNFIDAGALGGRCIALNVYCDSALVRGNTLTSQASATGILASQVSGNASISNNTFKGTFGGGRDIAVVYLSTASITENTFQTSSTSNIEIDTGGFAVVSNNTFAKSAYVNGTRAVYVRTIDVQSTTQGSTATVLAGSGVIFQNNILKKYGIAVLADMSLLPANLNLSAVEIVQVTDNTFMNYDLSTGGDRPVLITTGTTANQVNVRYERNTVLPYTVAYNNLVSFTGTGYLDQASQTYMALIEITTTSLASTKIAGANFLCTASVSGSDLVLTPRTQLDAFASVIATPIAFVDAGGTTRIFRFAARVSGSQYLLSAYDSAGAQINLSSASTKFRVLLGPVSNAT